MAQFAPNQSLIELIDVVRAVSAWALPDDPTACTTRLYDQAREPAGYPDATTAKATAQRMKLPWSSVLLAAHSKGSSSRSVSVRRRGQGGRTGLSLGQGLVAMRAVAGHRGQRSLTRGQYGRSREQIVMRDRRGRHGGRAELGLPSLNRLDALLEKAGLSWADACAAAGLEPRAPQSLDGKESLQWDDAVRVFIEHTGTAPRNLGQVRTWAAAVRVALADGSTKVVEEVTGLQQQRLAQGLPELPLAEKGRTFLELPPLEGYARRPNRNPTPAAIVAGLAQAIRRLPAHQLLLSGDLEGLREEYPDDGIPAQSTIQKVARRSAGSFEQWRREAYEMVQAVRTAAGDR